MIRLNLYQLFKNKTLWAWPGLFLLFVIAMLYWGDIGAAQNSYSFTFILGEGEIPMSMIMSQLTSFVILICIIGLPNHFSKNLTPERGSLLLSKPISRSQLFFSDFVSVCTVLISYTIISVVLMAILLAVKATIFPVQFFLALLLFLPLLIMTYYISIVLFLILTESYLGGALLGWIVTGFSSIFLNSDKILSLLGLQSDFASTFMDILSYLIPSAGGVQKIITQIYSGGFSAIDGGLFAFVLASCLPFGLLSYYFLQKKEF